MALLEERAAVKAAELVAARDLSEGRPEGSGSAGPAEARLGAVDVKYFAKTLADAVTETMRGEPRLDERVPSVYAEQGVTAAQYAQVKASIKSLHLSPPDKWSDSEGARDRDVKFFLQELRTFFEITCMPRAGTYCLTVCT